MKKMQNGFIGILALLIGVALIVFFIVRTDLFTGGAGEKNVIEQGTDAIQKAKDVRDLVEGKTKVEQYIRDNISTLAPDSPVLGGTWNVLTVTFDQTGNSGVVVYEDGHIQSTATFTYTQIGDDIEVLMKKK